MVTCTKTHTHTHIYMQPKRFNSTAASLCCSGCCWVNCQSESWVVVLQSDSRQSLLPSRNVRHCRGEGHLQSASVYEGKSSQGHLHYDTGLAHTLLHSGWVGHGLCHFTLWLVPDLNQKFDVIVTPHVSAVMPDHSSVVQMLHSGMWAVPSPTPEQKWAKHSWHQSCAQEGRQLHHKNHGNLLDSRGEEDGRRQHGAELEAELMDLGHSRGTVERLTKDRTMWRNCFAALDTNRCRGRWWWWCRASCPRMSVDLLGTSWPMQKHGSMLLCVHRNHTVHEDGKPRMATLTFTQLLNCVEEVMGVKVVSRWVSKYQWCLFWHWSSGPLLKLEWICFCVNSDACFGTGPDHLQTGTCFCVNSDACFGTGSDPLQTGTCFCVNSDACFGTGSDPLQTGTCFCVNSDACFGTGSDPLQTGTCFCVKSDMSACFGTGCDPPVWNRFFLC